MLIISGAIGNLIDRVRLGFVVDYFDFRIIWEYVFNVADVFVVVGTAILCIYILFFEDERAGEIMDEIREFLVGEEEEGDRLDVYLSEQLGDMSRSYIQKIIKDKKVEVNNKIEKAKYLVKEEDKIKIEIPAPKLLEVIAQDIPIDIVYEDNDVLIVNKPQDMVVHPAPGNYDNTLVNAILYHCKDNLSSINGVIRPGIVHRIDKDTSGLLMIAKNNNAHNSLAEQLKDHSITREYEFICHGVVKEDKITVDKPIGRNPKDRLKMAVVKDGKACCNSF